MRWIRYIVAYDPPWWLDVLFGFGLIVIAALGGGMLGPVADAALGGVLVGIGWAEK